MKAKQSRWLILIASCLINLCIGSLYAWSVFSLPMEKYLSSLNGGEVGSLAIVFTIANSVGPITMILGGFLNRKFGVKRVIQFGGALFGVGMILSGFAKSLGMLIVTYGLLVGLGVGMVYGCTISNTIRFFPDKKGLIGGLTTASYGISSVIIPMVANGLMNYMDVTSAFKVIGIVMFAIIMFCSIVMKDNTEVSSVKVSGTHEYPWYEMLKNPVFYCMLAMLCCGAFSGLMIISQASPLAQRMIQATSASAALIVSIIALFNTLGRVAAGWLSDKIGVLNTNRIVFVGSILGLSLLYVANGQNPLLFYLGTSIVGFTFGSIMGIFPGFCAMQFGSLNNGVNYGIMFIGFAAAGFFGPTILSSLYVSSGSDQMAFLVAIILNATGLSMTYLYTVLNRKQLP